MPAGKDEHVWGFDYHDAVSLKQSLSLGAKMTAPDGRGQQGGYIAKTPSGGIAARSGDTVTMVDCDIYYLSGTGSTRTVTPTGITLPVGNMSTTAIAGSVYIMVAPFGGALMAPWEDC
jgi:hypothetical protein